MDYASVKLVHESAAALSFLGFFARGAGMVAGARWIHGRPAKTLPHVVDTVLLVSALTLLWILRTSPLTAPWLAAKVAGLLVYIALGVIALRPTYPRPVRALAWLAAMSTFAYIVSVAITRDPRGFLAMLTQ
jgi:uncharacterized membrane protein SirB2